MKKMLSALLVLLPALAAAQPAEQVDDQSKLAPGVSRGVAFMCVNSADAIDASDFGTVRCGSTRQLMVEAIQSGTWNIGTVTSITNAVAVTGTFWQATQPVSGTVTANAGSGTFAVSGPLTDTQLRATPVPVSGTFWQATQPISGTVAATQSGTWTAQPGNTPNTVPWLMSIHDGTTKAAVFNLAANDPLSVAIVDGTGTQITSFGGGTQYTEADTDASVTGTAVMWEDAADTLRVASATKPLPVNVVAGGAGDGAILDGVSAAIKATVLDYTNSNPVAVRLTDTSGDYVGAGAGTQYADGAVQATPTGTVALGHDGSNVRALTTDAAGDLQVDILTAPTITVSGTVTANAGSGTLAVSGPLTDTQLRATPVPVSGTFWQATQPISGTVTANAGTDLNTSSLLTTTAHDAAFGTAGVPDAQVRSIQGVAGGTAVPVSGTFWQATQPVSWSGQTVTVTDGAGALNTIIDSGSVTVSDGAGALNVIVDSITAGDNNIGNVDVVSMPTTTVTATNLDVQIGGSDSLTIGTFPDNEPFNLGQVGGTSTVTGGVNGSLGVGGAAAHDGTTLPNPVLGGAVAETPEDSEANTSANRVSADADAVRLLANRYGVLYSNPCQGPMKWTYHENSSSALTDTTVHASCGTGLYNYICSIAGSTGAATAWNVFIEDSTTTTILGPFYLEAVAGRGFQVSFAAEGGKKQTTAATVISVTTSAAIAHSLDIQGYCGP